MSAIRKLLVFRSLNAVERSVFTEALALPVCISLGFWVLGVPRTQALLRRWGLRGSTRALPADSEHEIRTACYAQRIVKRSTGIGGPCLVRSMTLWAILFRRGLPTDLRVGFRKRDGQIEGHAWIEYHDVPLNEDIGETQTFVPYAQPVNFDRWRRIGRNEPVS